MPVVLSDGSHLPVKFTYEAIESDALLNKNRDDLLVDSRCVECCDSVGCLYVGQREWATVLFDDKHLDTIGSDDATTCHIVLIVDDATGNCAMCHFDGTDVQGGIEDMLESLKNQRQPSSSVASRDVSSFSLYVAGGFDDDRRSSIDLTNELFEVLSRSADVFVLKLAVVTKLNTTYKGHIPFPIVYGFGYRIKDKQVFKCNSFANKGPDMNVRSARHFSNSSNMNIYDPNEQKLRIGPFDFSSIKYIKQYLRMPDEVLLDNFSTSPQQEPEHFVSNLKQTFKAMLEYPDPIESYFKKRTHVYTKLPEGTWEREQD